MNIKDRQDIQEVNTKANHLALLMQTIYEGIDGFHTDQLYGLLGIAYELSSEIYVWTNKEETIVLENEKAARNE